jgi:hypothetical protein
MNMIKVIKDYFDKVFVQRGRLPAEVLELKKYFSLYGPIKFKIEKQEDGNLVAVSVDYKYGGIVTSAKNMEELDGEIKDAILTAFSIPSVYAKEAGVVKEGSHELVYAAVK